MTVIIQGTQSRDLLLGRAPTTKSTGTLAATTVPLFTIAGGAVLVTSLVGRVTTAITVANSYKLQINPTAGAGNGDLCAATDIGTTDTEVGVILGFLPGGSILRNGAIQNSGLVLPTGQIESVSAGTDGVILWHCTWVPYDNGASLVAV